MAFTFPEDKQDFTAANGVTYSWNGDKWVTKTFKADESALEPIVERLDEGEVIQGDLVKRVDDGEVKQRQIELALEELSVTKGSVARYTVTETHIGAAIRNGELYVSSPNAADVQAISFAPFDINGQPTRPANTGDIIEFVETTRSVGEVTRYRIVDGGDSQALVVDYISGNNNFAKGESEEVYIYPQNEEGVSKEYVDGKFLPLTGGELAGPLRLKRGDEKTHPQWKISPNGGTDHATNIYSLEGQMRFRTSHTGGEGDHQGSHIVLDPDAANGGANQTTKIYKVPLPNQPDMAASKAYVDQEVASAGGGGGVPVGSIMIWLHSTPPNGWFKLQGKTFDVSDYPLLHAYLQQTNGYVSGVLPDWEGRYPGEYGDHLAEPSPALGKKVSQKTAQPSGGAPKNSTEIPNGTTRGFNGAGGTNAYSNGMSKVTIDQGWDSVTRPPTVIVHYIIKHD